MFGGSDEADVTALPVKAPLQSLECYHHFPLRLLELKALPQQFILYLHSKQYELVHLT